MKKLKEWSEKQKKMLIADKQRKEEVELRNEADQLVLQTEKTLKDLEGKVDAAEVAKANEAKDALKAAIEKNELEEIRVKKDALTRNCSSFNCEAL